MQICFIPLVKSYRYISLEQNRQVSGYGGEGGNMGGSNNRI